MATIEEKPSGDKGIEKVDLDNVLRETSLHSPREVGPLARIGYRLALFILGYLSVVTIILLIDYLCNVPALPKGPIIDPAQINLYKELSQVSTERTLKLFDTLVFKGFLPVFTAVLGYIFGSREEK
ncbi:MAG: hypothetical protein AB9866_29595 [Syntrophobacteraceae bacterium]